MDLSMEQRLAIKFCFKAGKSVTETLQMVNAAYVDQALSRSTRCMGRRNLATAEKLRFQKSRVKTMLVIFFYW